MDVLHNIRAGIETAACLIKQGFAVYCPFLDFQIALSMYGWQITKKQFQANSIAFLNDCDAMIVLPGWIDSKGTIKETTRFDKEDKVFYNLQDLLNYYGPQT